MLFSLAISGQELATRSNSQMSVGSLIGAEVTTQLDLPDLYTEAGHLWQICL